MYNRRPLQNIQNLEWDTVQIKYNVCICLTVCGLQALKVWMGVFFFSDSHLHQAFCQRLEGSCNEEKKVEAMEAETHLFNWARTGTLPANKQVLGMPGDDFGFLRF